MQDEEGHRKNYQQQIDELTTKVKRMEDALRSTTTDYIISRRDKQAAEARAVAATDAQAREQAAAASKVRQRFCALLKLVPRRNYRRCLVVHLASQSNCTWS